MWFWYVVGWVGLGFSPTGGMVNSDVSISYIGEDGVMLGHTDRYADAHAPPTVDTLQDYYDIVFYTQ